jgi:DNA (cytosine-5)-methyltransferase 1
VSVLTSLELFAGAGGLALGTARAGFRAAAAVERDTACAETLRANGLPAVEADASAVDFSRWAGVDLVSGGPPCQPWSGAGRHGGQSDARDMFPTLVRAVREARPRLVLVENVKGLLRPKFDEYLRYILTQLSRPSVAPLNGESVASHMSRLADAPPEYDVTHGLLNAANFGVPQARERVFILASREGHAPVMPPPTHSLHALLRDQWGTDGPYWARHGFPRPDSPPAGMSARVAAALINADGLLPWRTVRDAISDIMDTAPPHPAKTYKGHTGSSLDAPSKTLKAGVHGVPGGENMVRAPGGDRHYAAREAARVQGFPDNWVFPHAWTTAMRQIGNAVPPPLAEAVARSLTMRSVL